VSTEQRENLDAILRQSAFPVDSDVNEQRRLLRELISAQPLPADVTVTAAALGGVPTAEITVDGIEPRHVVLYFHGGVYVMGDAFQAAGLASQVGRRTRAKVISVDYRLAPEHPYPAAVDDALAAYEALLRGGTAPSDIAFAGESAGGGLAIATLLNARDHGLPLPAAAFVMSPYADLTLAGTTMETKREADPLLSPQALQARVTDYTSGQDAALGLISPIFADLSGLPPLIIQAGTHEVLLDDAIRLARQAATADVEVTLDITPGVPHVFQVYYPILDEAAAALDRAGQLLSAHLTGSQTTGGPEQLSEIKGVARFKFHEGKVEEFKRLSVQAMDIVRAKDTGTLQYEIYINDDQSECVVYERYRDSQAVIEHGAHVGHLTEAIFATGSVSSELLGEPSAELTAMMAGSGVPLFRPFLSMETPPAGFDEHAPGSVDTPPHRSVRSGTDSRIGIRR
jgi:epsilon-lactone hydrolase